MSPEALILGVVGGALSHILLRARAKMEQDMSSVNVPAIVKSVIGALLDAAEKGSGVIALGPVSEEIPAGPLGVFVVTEQGTVTIAKK